jgi:uncharacterized protein YndB with AHSA1/START domain
MKRQVLALAAVSMAVGAYPATAEVVQSSPGGLVTRNEMRVSAPPARVWDELVEPAHYWNPEHSWFGDAAGLSLDLEPGGCFCEEGRAADGTVRRAEHARTVLADPARMLRLRGALGPLQSEALVGTLTVTLEPEAAGTRIIWEYVVGGHARFPLDEIAGAVDSVMAEQLARLVRSFESGAPD